MSYQTLAGRTAVVTGAASGIGAATARLLAASGASVALIARRESRLAGLAAEITAAGGRAAAVPADVTSDASVQGGADRVHQLLGRADLVVNAAGVMLPRPVEQGRPDEWARMIDTNLGGVLRVIRAFTGDLLAAAAERGAADLVNISSIGAHLTFPDYAVYGATKAAVTHLSAMLRAELGPRHVRVTSIEPGLTDSELAGHVDPAADHGTLARMLSTVPALSAADIADLVAYIASRPAHVNVRHVVALPATQA
jgi:NADP-dependent 3-hydroxy acid dehydrogenase YdfG